MTARASLGGGLAFELAPDPGLTDALCKGIEPELFFPERGDSRTAALAREICAQCPVVEACLADALQTERGAGHSNRFGIRGGKGPEERYAMYRRSLRASAENTVAPRSSKTLTKGEKDPAKCGTRGGYRRHRGNDESPCESCRAANAAADRRLRTTGSTKGAAA
ncbi:WhiB family transcriptional regulator [Streptomyces sp. 8N706]|uniref:WhiB family transcriptional regulator n=1 Tax=Streptomyces sp. 8N706 TaxID=3457416 RepID=UPI003FD26DA4